MKKRVLIVDDEELIRLSLTEGLKDFGYDVQTAFDESSALSVCQEFRPDVLLLDMRLGADDGLEVARQVKELDGFIEIIIMTAYGDIKTAIQAIKAGATDYLKKPLDLEEVNVSISKAIKNQIIQRKLEAYKQKDFEASTEVIGKSELMQEAIRKMDIMAQNESVTVLIRGETGTGKEVAAKYIHQNSERSENLMLSLNCAAIPSQLLESELFGFEKNAFSGAGARKRGLIELAHGGTLFLDELGEIPLDIQAKLLRFLETKKFKRVGGLDEIEVDIRVIAATNKDLEQAIAKKEFREDLYYRLNVVPIKMPPLRKRGADILALADHFLKHFQIKFKREDIVFSKETKVCFLKYQWPGNVRELKNMIERIVILNVVSIIDPKHLPLEVQNLNSLAALQVETNSSSLEMENSDVDAGDDLLPEGFDLDTKIAKIEIKYIEKALEKSEGHLSRAAEYLGISRYALKRRMEKYNLK